MTTGAPPGLSVQDVSLSLQRFGLADYLVFSTMLLVCIGIGVYFGWKDHQKQKRRATSSVRRGSEALDYLVGNRRMKIFPVAMSLVASWISGIALMGAATETYLYGIHFGFIFTGIILMAFSMNFIFLPVFHSLQITSVYEYLEIRFDTRIRLLGSVLFTLATGGIKAVVWTDVIQTVVMVGALILIVIKGTADIGGLSVLIERNVASGRIEPPNFSLDPTERTTIWAIFFGGGSFWVAKNAIHQMMIQRYLSLPTFRDAQKSLVVFTIGITFLMSICFYNGLLIYATFHDCDPLTTKLARAKDQLLPILVMQVFGDYPGLAGLFISGIFSASLSSLSTGLNSLAAIVLEDFVKPFTKNPLTERQTRYLMRGTVLVFGVIAVVLVLVVEKLGTVLQLSMSLVPISLGPLLGMFLMGMLLPWIDAKCAFAGACTGLTTMAYVVIRAQIAIASKEIVHPTKPVSTAGCTYHFDNVTTVYQDPMIHEEFDNYWKKRNVPGPSPHPLFGNFPSFILRNHPIAVEMDNVYREYKSKYNFVGVFSTRSPRIFVTSAELAKSILIKDFKNFHDNEFAGMTDKELDPILGRNPFMLNGDEWKAKRAELLKIGMVSKSVEKFFTKLMAEAIQYREKNGVQRVDYLEHLISLRNKKEISDLDMAAHGVTFFIDGFETSSVAMSFILYELAKNPDVQERLRKELLNASNDQGTITYDLLLELPYLDQVINESLRLWPPAAFLSKKCTEPIELNLTSTEKKLIETDVCAIIPVWSIHRDPNHFEDPATFNPDRFSPERGGASPYREKGCFMPFGDGPRQCLGIRFARMQVKRGVYEILTHFELTVDSKTVEPLQLDPKQFLTMALGGIWLNFKPIAV
ncbi:hypothetical protein quinque_002014 [Culex quinquefasciatus]